MFQRPGLEGKGSTLQKRLGSKKLALLAHSLGGCTGRSALETRNGDVCVDRDGSKGPKRFN